MAEVKRRQDQALGYLAHYDWTWRQAMYYPQYEKKNWLKGCVDLKIDFTLFKIVYLLEEI